MFRSLWERLFFPWLVSTFLILAGLYRSIHKQLKTLTKSFLLGAKFSHPWDLPLQPLVVCFQTFLLVQFHLLSFLCSLPLVRRMPERVQILFFIMAKIFIFFILQRLFFALEYLFMEDLYRAVEPFLPHSSGGGGSCRPPQLPDPAGNVGVVGASIENPFADCRSKVPERCLPDDEGASQPIREPLLSEEEKLKDVDLRQSREWRETEKHLTKVTEIKKSIGQNAKAIAQIIGFNPYRCDAVEMAALDLAEEADNLPENRQVQYLVNLGRGMNNYNSESWDKIIIKLREDAGRTVTGASRGALRSEEKKSRVEVWMVPTKACLLLCYQSWIDSIFSQCPCSYYSFCCYSDSHGWLWWFPSCCSYSFGWCQIR